MRGAQIAMVGKYTNLSDAYLSVIKALQHACLAADRKLALVWIDAQQLEDSTRVSAPKSRPDRECLPLSASTPFLSCVPYHMGICGWSRRGAGFGKGLEKR